MRFQCRRCGAYADATTVAQARRRLPCEGHEPFPLSQDYEPPPIMVQRTLEVEA